MRILLTGASGMIGANLAHRLAADGHDLFALVRTTATPPRLEPLGQSISLVAADLTDMAGVASAITQARPEAIFHMASTPFNPPPAAQHHFAVNVSGTRHLMESAIAHGVRRVIFTGSAAQYGSGDDLEETQSDQPATLLGISKCCAADVVHGYGRLGGIETVELRLFTPFGPWERPGRLIPHTILSALGGGTIKFGDGRQERDWLHIDDVVDGMVRALAAPLPPATVINLCSGQGRSIRHVVGEILRLMNTSATAEFGALPTRTDEIWKLSGQNNRARSLLGWSPRMTLAEGLHSTIGWFTTHRAIAERLT